MGWEAEPRTKVDRGARNEREGTCHAGLVESWIHLQESPQWSIPLILYHYTNQCTIINPFLFSYSQGFLVCDDVQWIWNESLEDLKLHDQAGFDRVSWTRVISAKSRFTPVGSDSHWIIWRTAGKVEIAKLLEVRNEKVVKMMTWREIRYVHM